MLSFNESNDEEGYNSDFKNSFKLKGEDELDLNLNKEILLFKDNLNLNLKPKEGTSFIDIKEYLAKIALIKPLKLPPTKILDILSQPLILGTKLYSGYYNNRTRI
jgi:hypothetical protein